MTVGDALLVLATVASSHALLLPTTRCASSASLIVRRSAILMQAEPIKDEAVEAGEAAPEGYATFYDDEKDDAVLAKKPPISDAMRKKLLNEQRGIGADPNSKNPFLFVFAGVGIFVVLGALAVNM
mmetsp:Transcript_44283/g.88488  ORF Transcript_44283/g.88488 Transcript_44283/m.88488 type:complete len:126 (-) Transcript_44283:317-694(-)